MSDLNSKISISDIKQSKYIPLTEWSKFHSWPSVSGLRNLVFHARTNGFQRVICRIGRRVLIKEAAFFNWLEQHGGEK